MNAGTASKFYVAVGAVIVSAADLLLRGHVSAREWEPVVTAAVGAALVWLVPNQATVAPAPDNVPGDWAPPVAPAPGGDVPVAPVVVN